MEKYFSVQEFGKALKLQNILYLFNNLENIFYVVLIFFSMYVLGSKILKFFSLKNIEDEIKVIFSISFGAGGILIFIFVIGIIGFLYKWVVLSIILVLDVLGIFEILIRRSYKSLNFNLSLHKLSNLEKLQFVLCILMFFVILVGCLLPEIFYDSLVYHLAKPNFWIQNHKLIPDKSYMMSFFYPGNSNLLFVIGLFFKDETICKLINFSFNILTTLLLYFIGKKFFNQKVGFLASVLFFTTPYIGILSWRSAVEMILAFFEALTIFSFVMWVLEQDYKYLIISAINCGLAIGTKYTSLYCLTAIICCIILKNISEKKSIKVFIKDIVM
ncbi:MAG: glycosyltransferase family 39 protein, partial [candidate division WOR-3 bacterium]